MAQKVEKHSRVPFNTAGNIKTLNAVALWIFVTYFITNAASESYGRFEWVCSNEVPQCRRIDEETKERGSIFPSIEVCRLVCGDYGALWPKPNYVQFTNRNLTIINPSQLFIHFDPKYHNEMTKNVTRIFKENILKESKNCQGHKEIKLVINISLSSNSTQLSWNTDESYSVKLNAIRDKEIDVLISGKNIFGVRHALETLTQLMTSYPETNNSTCLAIVNGVKIADRPVYSHRGLLLDSSRNFLSIDIIKKHIDAMAASKMNFLHWHITDSHSFPMETPSVANMSLYGAYSTSKQYKYADIRNLIKYAIVRGVRIILELDAPSHAGYGWQWGPEAGLGNLTVCLNHQPWRKACIQPPCGQLNPSNQRVYDVLEKIYSDMINLLPDSEIFHMGGDEVFIPCWNMTDEILRYIGNKNRSTETFLDLWGEFQNEALRRYDKASKNKNANIILWTSDLTDPTYVEKYLDKNRYIIQTWVPNTDDLPDQLLDLGYKLIISTKNAWYLDHGFWGTTQYYDWRTVYDNYILLNPNVLGGEVCMWGEYVDDNTVLGRVWPRAAAAAERLWSNPPLKTSEVEARFYRHRERLVTREIYADMVIPRWCYYNEGQC